MVARSVRDAEVPGSSPGTPTAEFSAASVRAVAHQWSLDVAIAPAGASAKIASALNRPKKRAFGVLKTESEFVGFVRDDTFEIWERQGRAIHGLGSIRGRRGGSRVEVRLVLPLIRKVVIAVFYVLYAIVALGIATQPPRPDISIEEFAVAVGGGVLLAAIFTASAARQRADLKGFLERTFSEVPRL